MRLKIAIVRFCGSLLLSAFFMACDTQFEPFADTDSAFTILGFLDTDADTQFVRIVPLRPLAERPDQPRIDAVVHSHDLASQTAVEWSDSLIWFPDSTSGHVFWSEFRAIPGKTYRLEIERSDGEMTWAETTVPLRPGDPELVYGAPNESASYAPLFWPGVTDVIDVDVLYDITFKDCVTLLPITRVVHRIRYEGDARGVETSAGEWRVDLDLWSDHDVLGRVAGLEGLFCASLGGLWVRLATPSTEFDPPGGVWDRELLIQPGTISNVEGGFGFFGSVARSTIKWELTRSTLGGLLYNL